FTLTRTAPDFLARLSMPFFQAIPLSLGSNLDRNGVNVVPGCGPYWIAAHTANQSITLERNPYYTGPRPANFDEIDYKIGNNDPVIEQDTLNGTTDLTYSAPPNDWKRL